MKAFWKAALVRAARTMAQTALGIIPAGMMITAVDWKFVAGSALTAGILSVLTSMATGLPEVDEKK